MDRGAPRSVTWRPVDWARNWHKPNRCRPCSPEACRTAGQSPRTPARIWSYTTVKVIAGQHVAERLNRPAVLALPIPMFVPTREFPAPDVPASRLVANRATFLGMKGVATMFGRTVDRWQQTLDLPKRRGRHDPLHSPMAPRAGAARVPPSPATSSAASPTRAGRCSSHSRHGHRPQLCDGTAFTVDGRIAAIVSPRNFRRDGDAADPATGSAQLPTTGGSTPQFRR